MPTVKFQTLDKQLRCLFDTLKRTWLPGSPSVLWLLPIRRYGWHTLPTALNFLAQELGCPSLRGFSLIKPRHFGFHFCPSFALLASWLLYLFLPSPFARHLSIRVQGHDHAELSRVCLPLPTAGCL